MNYECPYCTKPLPDEHSQCCGKVGEAIKCQHGEQLLKGCGLCWLELIADGTIDPPLRNGDD